MLEVQIDRTELERLVGKLEKSPQVLQEARRKAMEAAAPKLLSAVRAEIGGSGKVQRWQEAYVGSRGGYAAARPRAETYTEATKGGKRYAVGYVTNAVNSGHKYPTSKLGFRSRVGSVPGKQFYQRAGTQLSQVAQEAAQQVVQALTDHLGG